MIIKQVRKLRTGSTIASSRGSSIRQLLQLPRVANPIASAFAITSPISRNPLRDPSPNMQDIYNAYMTDSYIRQGIDKYVELIMKEGWKLDGGEEQVDYIKTRLKYMAIMADPPEPWDLLLFRIVTDFVKYGNSLILVKRSPQLAEVTDGKIVGAGGLPPIGALFTLPVHLIQPKFDEKGNLSGWKQKGGGRSTISYSANDVLHFSFFKEPGEVWGTPTILQVIEDVRALRQIEESIIKLIHKHLNPLIQQEIPDVTGTGEGRQEDIEAALEAVQTMAVDGYIITPPGHKIRVIGAESQAIRAEGYYKMFKQRVFSGLGLSSVIMGEVDTGTRGTSESLTTQMHNKAKLYQFLLAEYITAFIINELLLEGGYNPYANPDDIVTFRWNEIENDSRIKEEAHALSMWTMNAISLEELRSRLNLATDADMSKFYVHQVQIPQALAAKFGYDPLMDNQPLPDTLNKQNKEDKINSLYIQMCNDVLHTVGIDGLDRARIVSVLNNYMRTDEATRLVDLLLYKIEDLSIEDAKQRIIARLLIERPSIVTNIEAHSDTYAES